MVESETCQSIDKCLTVYLFDWLGV